MGKVYRQDKKSVQRVRARDIVPGDIVEVAGKETNSTTKSIIHVVEIVVDKQNQRLSLSLRHCTMCSFYYFTLKSFERDTPFNVS